MSNDKENSANINLMKEEQEKKGFRVLKFNSDKEFSNQISLKEAVIANLIVGILALSIYFPVEFSGNFYLLNERYYFHVLLSLICFVMLPTIYLTIYQIKTRKARYFFTSTQKGLSTRKIISSLIQGLAMHAGIFFPWVLLTQKFSTSVDSLSYYLPTTKDWVLQLVFFTLNVLMFEFYSKAFIQIQFTEAKGELLLFNGKLKIKGGKWLGFILQNLVWLGGHVQEFFWLKDYLGPINAIFFILVSGILTGLTVLETENFFGVVVGHVLLNVLLTITYAR